MLDVRDLTFLQFENIFPMARLPFPQAGLKFALNIVIVLGNIIKLHLVSCPAVSGIDACAGYFMHLVTP